MRLEGLVDEGGNWNRFKANLDVPSVTLRDLSGENLCRVQKIRAVYFNWDLKCLHESS